MNWIAGIYNIDGRPVDPELLDQLAEPVRPLAVDGYSAWTDGPVGMVSCRFNTTRECLDEPSPLVAPDRTFSLSFDGRLDNRDDLVRALRSRTPALDTTTTDAELLAGAYNAWGARCL